jgi:guanylate kinase
MPQNKAIIVSAPSGSGKTTIVKYLLSNISQLKFSISATSRQKRDNEQDGVDYYFLSHHDFVEKIEHDEFVEWEEVYDGSYYGTLKSEVSRIWDEGHYIIFDVDVQGAIHLKKYFRDKGLSLFIRVKDQKVLEKRLRQRGTENEHDLRKRIKKATSEMKFESKFDRIIVNDSLEIAQKESEKVVRSFLNLQ